MLSSIMIQASMTAVPGFEGKLREVNSNWIYHFSSIENPCVQQEFDNETELIQFHLKCVEDTLRKYKCEVLNEKQRKNRLHLLDILQEYRIQGVFPQNTRHSSRTPYFIDDYGTACAVGQLMISSGYASLAKKISSENNNGYIYDFVELYPQIVIWAKEHGFTIAELAWIQPCYAPPVDTIGIKHPTCHSAWDGYFRPQFNPPFVTPFTKSFYKFDGSAWIPLVDMCGYWRYNNLQIGKYKWELKDLTNTIYTYSVELKAPSPATVTITKSGNFYECKGLLTATAQGGTLPYAFYWNTSFVNNPQVDSVCEGGVTLTFFEGGNWWSVMTCPQVIEIKTGPVGLLEENLSRMQIAPNPVRDVLYVKDISISENESKKVKILNYQGQFVLETELNSENAIPLDQLPSGMYFIQFGEYKPRCFVKE